MKRIINYPPSRGQRLFLGILPFLLILLVYVLASEVRLSVNPTDKLMPALTSFKAAMERMMFTPDKASGTLLFWWDTYLSLWRLIVGLGLCALLGLVLGTPIGFIPQLRAAFDPVLAAISLVPPLAVLPILFILFGLGEVSKIVLIVFGVAPCLMRDVVLRIDAIPREQIIKAQTLGGSTWQMMTHVILPQILPYACSSGRPGSSSSRPKRSPLKGVSVTVSFSFAVISRWMSSCLTSSGSRCSLSSSIWHCANSRPGCSPGPC